MSNACITSPKALSITMVAHTFNLSTQEAEVDRSLNSRPARSTGEFQDTLGYTEKPCLKKQKKTKASKQTCA